MNPANSMTARSTDIILILDGPALRASSSFSVCNFLNIQTHMESNTRNGGNGCLQLGKRPLTPCGSLSIRSGCWCSARWGAR